MSTDMTCGDPDWPMMEPEKTDKVVELERQIMESQIAKQELLLDILQEQHYRDTNPGLKELWDEYQTMLILIKEH